MKKKTYSDIDLDFSMHPYSGDVSKLKGTSAIIRAIRNLVFTNYYDRSFHPEKGNWIAAALFENDVDYIEAFVKEEIYTLIEAYEPRATDVSIEIKKSQTDENSIVVNLAFFVQTLMVKEEFSIILEQVR